MVERGVWWCGVLADGLMVANTCSLEWQATFLSTWFILHPDPGHLIHILLLTQHLQKTMLASAGCNALWHFIYASIGSFPMLVPTQPTIRVSSPVKKIMTLH